jgi:hypothetical protein
MKQDFKTPAYTTDWQGLLTVQNDAVRAVDQWPSGHGGY